MARYLSLSLLGVVLAATTVPTIDLTSLFNRLTVPLGTVPMID